MLEVNHLILISVTLVFVSLFIFCYWVIFGSKREQTGLKQELTDITERRLKILKKELTDVTERQLKELEQEFQVEIKKQMQPKKCPHYLGYLNTRPSYISIPDECTGCPRISQCFKQKTTTK